MNNFSEWVGLDGNELVFRYLPGCNSNCLVYAKTSRDLTDVKVISARKNEYNELCAMRRSYYYSPNFNDSKVASIFMRVQNENAARRTNIYDVVTTKSESMKEDLLEYLKNIDKENLVKTTSEGFIVDGKFYTLYDLPSKYEEKAFREEEIYRFVKFSN